MKLCTETFDEILHQLRTLRTELTTAGDTAEATSVSRLTSECESWISAAHRRESEFLPFEVYHERFRSQHIEPFLNACPSVAEQVNKLVDDWFNDQKPASKNDPVEAELADAMEALADAVADCDHRAAINAAKVIMPLARRLETKRLKLGDYISLNEAAKGERDLAESIIKLAYEAVTGRAVRLRKDTGKDSLGGYVRVDGDYQDSPEWFGICDSIPADAVSSSSLLTAIFNSSLSVPSRWAAARVRLYVDGDLVPYSTADFPWCLSILDARNPRGPLKLFILKSTQVGITTALFLRVLFEVDYCGRTAIFYMPDEAATKKLNIRLENLIEGSPYLSARIVQTSEAKRIGMATLHLEGSRGFSAGRSQSSDVIVLDEFDLFDPANAEEIGRRLTGSKRGLEICASTPRYPGCGIDGLVERFQAQREAFKATCPFCYETIQLDYPDAFERFGEYENDPACADSYIKCPKCHERIDPETKTEMLADGKWELVDPKQQRGNVRVFQGLNHLYSNSVTAEDLARASLRFGEAATREFHNSNLGKPYVEARGQILLKTLVNSISPKYSMAQHELFPSIKLDDPPRLLLVDQGRPASVVVAEYRIGKREDWHSSNLDRFVCRVLWAEKVDQHRKIRLDEIAYNFSVWSCCVDADPDETLPGFLLHSPQRHLHSAGYVVAIRSLDQWTTPEGIETPGVPKGDSLPRLSLVNVHRTQYYAAAIRRANAGNVILPSDISNQFIDELQNMILTHRPDPTGSPRLYAKARDGKPHDYLSCLQLGEVGLQLLNEHRIGVVVRQPATFRI
jgi:hypothetical protein